MTMQDVAYKQWHDQWLSDMGSDAGSSRIDRGPVETLASKAGRQAPKRNRARGRVPAPTAAQTRKGGPPS
jgi:hypothetical protein